MTDEKRELEERLQTISTSAEADARASQEADVALHVSAKENARLASEVAELRARQAALEEAVSDGGGEGRGRLRLPGDTVSEKQLQQLWHRVSAE